MLVGTLRFLHPRLTAKPSVVFVSYIGVLNTIRGTHLNGNGPLAFFAAGTSGSDEPEDSVMLLLLGELPFRSFEIFSPLGGSGVIGII